MTKKSRQCFESTIRNGDPCARRHYERVIAQVLSGARPDDDPLELFPWHDETHSGLAYALWRIRWAEFIGEPDGPTRPGKVQRKRYTYDHEPIAAFLAKHHWRNEDFARVLGISKGSCDQLRAGYMNSRPMVSRAMSYIEAASK